MWIDINIQGNYNVGKQSDPDDIDNSSITIGRQPGDLISVELSDVNHTNYIEIFDGLVGLDGVNESNPSGGSWINATYENDSNGPGGQFLINLNGVWVEGADPNGIHHKLRFN